MNLSPEELGLAHRFEELTVWKNIIVPLWRSFFQRNHFLDWADADDFFQQDIHYQRLSKMDKKMFDLALRCEKENCGRWLKAYKKLNPDKKQKWIVGIVEGIRSIQISPVPRDWEQENISDIAIRRNYDRIGVRRPFRASVKDAEGHVLTFQKPDHPSLDPN